MAIEHTSLKELLERASNGDRDAGAELVARYGPQIRRQIRMKLSGRMRRIFDSTDVISSLSRRVDLSVAKGQLAVESEAQLLKFLKTVVRNTVVDQARKAGRLRDSDTEAARAMATSDQAVLDREGVSIIEELGLSSTDRLIVDYWRDGRRHAAIAAAVGLSEPAVRQRLSRVLRRARAKLSTDLEAMR